MRDSVVIVGSGMMGAGIAAVSALAKKNTILIDTDKNKAIDGVLKAKQCIKELADNGLASKADVEPACSRISAMGGLAEALEKAEFVIEAVYENLQLKQELFAEMDALLPEDIPIASNTSGLRITDIALNMKYPGRAVTAHFWFPGHLVPLVEVVIGDKTDEKVALWVKEELDKWGKAPVLVRKDLPGQLANRILQAIIREAVDMVATGLASPEDIDTAIKMGMGIRFPVWGPLEHIDAVGLDLAINVQNTVLPDISAEQNANALLSELVEKGELGHKTGKGIYDWAKKDMTKLAARRNEFIISARKVIAGME